MDRSTAKDPPMTAVDHFNLRSFDLNLLLAFDALMQELSVTRAAERLRIQQPAMSHALRTLRTLLQDPLFVRIGSGMVPTARASELADRVRRILQDTQDALLRRPDFDPARAQAALRIGINLQLEMSVLPPLVAELRQVAPNVSVVTSPISRHTAFRLLDEGGLDLLLGFLPGGASWHERERLFDESHACCFNRASTGLEVPISLADYKAAAHGFISTQDNPAGYLAEALARRRIRPRVAVSSPNFITLAAAALAAPIVVTMATRIARQCAPMLGLATSPLPFSLAPLPIDMIWHARSQGDPLHAWFRDRVRSHSIAGAAVAPPGADARGPAPRRRPRR